MSWYAARYYYGVYRDYVAAFEIADLEQCGFIAMVEAVKVYDPTRGSFNALLWYCMKNQFQGIIGRSKRKQRDPLNYALSLDAPLDDDDPEGDTWHDAVADPRADRTDELIESIYQEQLHKALEDALDSIPAREAQALRAEFWQGKNQTETAKEMGVTDERVRQLRNGGLRHIRNSSAMVMLEKFIDYKTPFYRKVSIDQFNRTQTSAVEALMLYREKVRSELLGKGNYST